MQFMMFEGKINDVKKCKYESYSWETESESGEEGARNLPMNRCEN